MAAPEMNEVQAYYDERVEQKLRDFTHRNPRIEAAIQLISEWAPKSPRRVLEIGCGIGATSWRMAKAWPQAEVIGTDVSSASICVAKTCFQRPNLAYHHGLLEEGVLQGTFDLIVLMDVYEHIAIDDRKGLHSLLHRFLSDDSRLVLSFPTPALQQYIRTYSPQDLQPVDEDIGIPQIATFAEESETEIVYYRTIGIWRYGDYSHLVLGRYQALASVKLREYVHPSRVVRLKQIIKRMIGREHETTSAFEDYLGVDLIRPRTFDRSSQFRVSFFRRRTLAERWFRRNRDRP